MSFGEQAFSVSMSSNLSVSSLLFVLVASNQNASPSPASRSLSLLFLMKVLSSRTPEPGILRVASYAVGRGAGFGPACGQLGRLQDALGVVPAGDFSVLLSGCGAAAKRKLNEGLLFNLGLDLQVNIVRARLRHPNLHDEIQLKTIKIHTDGDSPTQTRSCLPLSLSPGCSVAT